MAEHVQADLELMLTELEQMQRVGLLTPEETKLVIKKRKRFEYKLQKQTKVKEDILSFIQYESSLLDLIEMRRAKIGYLHKKNEIDGAISKRINKLFRIAECRFGQTDPKIWMTHLAFLQRLDWKAEAGKVLERFKQVLSQVEDVWIYAARFHSSNTDLARRHLLEALRIHGSSIPIYREYFMVELHFLKNEKEEKDQQADESQIVEVVFLKAVEATNEPLFASELLGLAIKSKIPKLYEKLKNAYIEKHGDKCSTWVSLAILELYEKPFQDNRTVCKKVNDATNVLLDGIERLQSHEMMEESIQILQQVEDISGNQAMFRILEKCHYYHLLTDELTKIFYEYK